MWVTVAIKAIEAFLLGKFKMNMKTIVHAVGGVALAGRSQAVVRTVLTDGT